MPIPEGYYEVDGICHASPATAEEAVKVLLSATNANLSDPHLKDTPRRMVAALLEMTAGYDDDPGKILERVFPEDYDEVVVVRNIPFVSLCAHHVLTFAGEVDIGYLPSRDGIVGLSKLPRLVECYARRLQVQERMCRQIADAIDLHLSPRGVGVIVRAKHSCLECRGIRKPGTTMITSVMRGVFREKSKARAEFLSLVGM